MSVQIIIPDVQIAESNIVGHKFFDMISDRFDSYIEFIVAVKSRPEWIESILPAEHRAMFMDSKEVILFPAKFETAVQENNKRLIYKIVNRFKNLGLEEDDIFVEGQMAVRKALWNYNNPEVKLSTLAFKYVTGALCDYRKHVIRKKKRVKEKNNLFDSNNKNTYQSIVSRAKVMPEPIDDDEKMSLNQLLFLNCNDEFDKDIVKIYMENKGRSEINWVEIAAQQHMQSYNDTISSNAIRNRFNKIVLRTEKFVKDNNIVVGDIVI